MPRLLIVCGTALSAGCLLGVSGCKSSSKDVAAASTAPAPSWPVANVATAPNGVPPATPGAQGTAMPAAYGAPINPNYPAAVYQQAGPALQAPGAQYPAVAQPGYPTASYPAAGAAASPGGVPATPNGALPNSYPLPAPYGAPQGSPVPQGYGVQPGYAAPGASLSPGYTPGQQPLSMPAVPPSENINAAQPAPKSCNPFTNGFHWWKKRQDNFDYEPIRKKREGMREEVPYSD